MLLNLVKYHYGSMGEYDAYWGSWEITKDFFAFSSVHNCSLADHFELMNVLADKILYISDWSILIFIISIEKDASLYLRHSTQITLHALSVWLCRTCIGWIEQSNPDFESFDLTVLTYFHFTNKCRISFYTFSISGKIRKDPDFEQAILTYFHIAEKSVVFLETFLITLRRRL